MSFEKSIAQVMEMMRNPEAFGRAMSEAPAVNNRAISAFQSGQYDKALKLFKKSLKIQETGFGESHHSLSMPLTGLAECYMKLNDFDSALKEVKKLDRIVKKNKIKEQMKTVQELLEEIEKKSSEKADAENVKPSSLTTFKTDENEKQLKCDEIKAANCGNCKATDPKFHCGACKTISYCTVECQKADWKTHKPKCIVIVDKNESIGKKCGLCGSNGSRLVPLTKTQCCKRWICDDEGFLE